MTEKLPRPPKQRNRQPIEDETRHLLASPKNAERLLRSIAEMAAGKVIAHDPIDE